MKSISFPCKASEYVNHPDTGKTTPRALPKSYEWDSQLFADGGYWEEQELEAAELRAEADYEERTVNDKFTMIRTDECNFYYHDYCNPKLKLPTHTYICSCPCHDNPEAIQIITEFENICDELYIDKNKYHSYPELLEVFKRWDVKDSIVEEAIQLLQQIIEWK